MRSDCHFARASLAGSILEATVSGPGTGIRPPVTGDLLKPKSCRKVDSLIRRASIFTGIVDVSVRPTGPAAIHEIASVSQQLRRGGRAAMKVKTRAASLNQIPVVGGIERPDGEYLSARDAARLLGVSVQTLYVYVSRKGIRSQPIAGSRQRRYWKADIERVARREAAIPAAVGQVRQDSEITLTTDSGLFYRGHNVTDLAEHSTFESVAALLWGIRAEEAFTGSAPKVPTVFPKLHKLMAHESEINRATAFLPLFEESNPKAYDLSPAGMARTGADVLRTLAAIAVGSDRPTAEPVHQFIARHIGANALQSELIRRQLVLAADHGFEPGSVAVRALAGTGVTPWRSVIAGLTVTLGCRTRLSGWGAVSRLLAEIIASSNPAQPVVERIRAGEAVPGFHAPLHARGDPRARALFGFCATALAKDTSYQRIAEALAAAKSIQGLEPNFALAFLFVDGKTGVGPRRSLFHVGRCAGWIAHAIEQFQSGESERIRGIYKGALPA
jgi:citrate synthase